MKTMENPIKNKLAAEYASKRVQSRDSEESEALYMSVYIAFCAGYESSEPGRY